MNEYRNPIATNMDRFTYCIHTHADMFGKGLQFDYNYL